MPEPFGPLPAGPDPGAAAAPGPSEPSEPFAAEAADPGAGPVLPAARAIPARPTEPPRIPAPTDGSEGVPDGLVRAPALGYQPRFPDAPGLNWAGPNDRWSRAWALETLAESPRTPPAPAALPPAPVEAPTLRDIELIRASLATVEPVADRATAHFYALIFVHHPEVRALFPAAMDVQRDRLFRALLVAARNADRPAELTEYLTGLGCGHRRYGTLSGHYGPVGECLVAALARYCGSRWDAETEVAWRRVYGLVSRIMIEAAERAALTSPPWWQAEIVSTEARTPDVAVLTLRPDQAYPYRAGQYATVETPWWPRVWRHFSLATAPRPDGLLTFHVKAVQAGWVSNALVHRAAPGDVLRLGPAAGGMVVDHDHPQDLLCLGGGTGIAPIAALVEEVAEHGAAGRSVEVYYGARQQSGLYALDSLRRLADRHPWLSVRPVVSAQLDADPGVEIGDLPEVAARHGRWDRRWDGRAAYLSGPPAMVRRAAAALLRAGLPTDRIHHDLTGDLAAG
ncbi:globin domain-containing protein [Kitasatospora camelliae]|uniref:nitric oxide dioxygenase n=1 Tax=Kitasatospora camelliae TaxID=3156397 RepID=A0AAU8JZH4_9ACTN